MRRESAQKIGTVSLGSTVHVTLVNCEFDGIRHYRRHQRTDTAKAAGVSNCPVCAGVSNTNQARIDTSMEVEHGTAWSRGGSTDLKHCEMLCVARNRAKGNR